MLEINPLKRSDDVSDPPVSAPQVSIVVPVYRPAPAHLQRCVDSVIEQTCHLWELLLVADGPQGKAVDRVLSRAAARDPRIHLIRLEANQGISRASQEALNRATGEYIALLDHDDELSSAAVGAVVAELGRFDDVDLAYSDEDKLDAEDGRRTQPFFKPAFSMERLRCQMYLGHLLVVRTETARRVGGFRSAFDGAQDHDLALRVAEQARRIVHLPRLLYHWRQSPSSTAMNPEAKQWASEAGRRAVNAHLERTGFPAEAFLEDDAPGVVRLEPRLTEEPMVSVIVPTGGSQRTLAGVETLLVERALSTLADGTDYPNFEIVVVLDSRCSDELGARTATACGARSHQVIRDRRSFNFARACNLGAVRSQGEVLVFLNDDTEIINGDWLKRLVMYATQPEIGAVGAKLLYGDGRVQHAGVWSRQGPAHRYVGFPADHPGNFRALSVAQNCLAVTAACLAVQRSKFELVGGFSTEFPLAYNDVDFCLKLLFDGYRNVVDCSTLVVHHESSSRDPTVEDWEVDRLHRRWGPVLRRDPFDNPNNLASGIEEYPPSPIRMVERKSLDEGVISVSGRAWPGDDHYQLGRPRNGSSLVGRPATAERAEV